MGPSILRPSTSTPAESIAPSFVESRHCPTGLKFSSAKPTGSMFRWHDAHTAFERCNSSCWRTVVGFSFDALASSGGITISVGGGSGGVLRRVDITYLPRMTGEVRFATDVNERMLP